MAGAAAVACFLAVAPVPTALAQAGSAVGSMPGSWSAERGGVRSRNIRIFMPPMPPRLGAAVEPPAFEPGQRNARRAPEGLEPYVDEVFYMPLATRLSEDGVNERMQRRLDSYLAAKLSLLNELHARIDAVSNESAAVREREFRILAEAQAPQLEALAEEAEEIRRDLISGTFLLQEDVDWNGARRWRLGASSFHTEDDAVRAQIHTLLGVAYYEKDVLPEYRYLLREIAYEIGELWNAPEGVTDALESGTTIQTDTSPLLFFSPHLSRVRLPATLPQSLLGRIADYEVEKSRIKKELVDVISTEDASIFGLTRSRAYRTMIEDHQQRLAGLEQMADEIRRELAAYPLPRPPAPPPVPPELGQRIEALIRERSESRGRLANMIEEVERIVSIERINTSRNAGGQQTLSVGMRSLTGDPSDVREANQIIGAFNQQTRLRNEQSARDMIAVRNELALLLGPLPEPELSNAINQVWDSYSNAMEELSLWVRYQDYRSAVFEPGLSAAQRRLLFGGAIAALELELPDSEAGPRETIIQPIQR